MKKLFIVLVSLFILAGCSAKQDYYGATNSALGGAAVASYSYDEEAYDYREDDYKAESYNYVDESAYNADTNSFDGKKIIYTGSFSFETKEYDQAKDSLNKLISQYGVSVINKQESDYDNYWYTTSYHTNGVKGRVLSMTLKVEVTKFDELVNALSSISNIHVTSSGVYSNDVTKRYNDNADQIESLEIQEKRLNEILAEAKTVSEILEVEDRLTEVRYRLKSLRESNLNIDQDVQFSTITISLKEVEKYSIEKYGFGERMKDAFGESWVNFVDFFKDLIILIIGILPFALLITAIILAINFIRVKKGKEKLSLKFLKKLNLKSILLILGIVLVLLIIIVVLHNL